MPPAKRDPASILDAIIERAPKLHAAGIKSLSFDGLSVELGSPYIIPIFDKLDRQLEEKVKRRVAKEDDEPEELPEIADPLMDRATYGGGRVPGFTRPKKEQP